MSSSAKDGYGLVIKTNEYTGNFEREMCAFLTGQVGECEVGDDMRDILVEEGVDMETMGFESYINHVPDDHGCHRPVSLDENDANNLIIYFHTKPSEKQIEHIKKYAPMFDQYNRTHSRMKEFNQNNPKINILGYELRKYNFNVESVEI